MVAKSSSATSPSASLSIRCAFDLCPGCRPISVSLRLLSIVAGKGCMELTSESDRVQLREFSSMPVAQRIALGNSSRTCSTKLVVRPEKPEEREDVSRKPCEVATRAKSVTARSLGGRAEGEEGNELRYGRIARRTTASRPRPFLAAAQASCQRRHRRHVKAGSEYGNGRKCRLSPLPSLPKRSSLARTSQTRRSPPIRVCSMSAARVACMSCGFAVGVLFFFLFRTESCDWRATTHGSIGSFVCPVPV